MRWLHLNHKLLRTHLLSYIQNENLNCVLTAARQTLGREPALHGTLHSRTSAPTRSINRSTPSSITLLHSASHSLGARFLPAHFDPLHRPFGAVLCFWQPVSLHCMKSPLGLGFCRSRLLWRWIQDSHEPLEVLNCGRFFRMVFGSRFVTSE